MNGRERGFLLLTSHLGDRERKALTVPQFRILAQAVQASQMKEASGEVQERDLLRLGFNRDSARRILQLLSQEALLDGYLQAGSQENCLAITRVSPGYPGRLRQRLGLDSPGCLWAKGDITILDTPSIGLVGSRDLQEDNRLFAYEAGRQAALQGYTLVSGNARGADTVAQEACLIHGGRVVSVVADRLCDHKLRENVLYLSEDGYDLDFSTPRALSRNRVIHALGSCTLVAQCATKGGTWDGTANNLKHGWSPVFCYDDGSEAMTLLQQMGAECLKKDQLQCLSERKAEQNLFDLSNTEGRL